jgi:hypothetical protein
MPTLPPLYAHIALNVKVVFLTCVYKSVNRCRKQKLVTQNISVLKSEPTSFLNSVYLKILVHFNYIYTHANIINLLIFIYTHPITYIERNRIYGYKKIVGIKKRAEFKLYFKKLRKLLPQFNWPASIFIVFEKCSIFQLNYLLLTHRKVIDLYSQPF